MILQKDRKEKLIETACDICHWPYVYRDETVLQDEKCSYCKFFAMLQAWELEDMETEEGNDVRPVVLCRDCVHFQQFRPHDGFCKIDGMLWNNDFFCANGIREGE